MARKVFDEKGNEVKLDRRGVPKKNRHALKCCLSFVITFVLIVGIGIGAAFFLGDMLLKRYDSEYGLKDYLGAINRLNNHRKVERKQLNNTYKDSDADAFTQSIADAVFLENINAADIQDIVSGLVDSAINDMDDNTGDSGDDSGDNGWIDGGGGGYYEDDYQKEKQEQEKQSKSVILDDGGETGDDLYADALNKLLELFSEDNINRAKLNAYSDDKIEDYYVSISDKSLAAFLNNIILNSVLDSPALKNLVDDAVADAVEMIKTNADINIKGFDYKNLLQIRQITFYATGEGDNKQVGIKIITQTNLKKTVNAIFKTINGDVLLGKDAKSLSKTGVNSLVFFAKTLITQILPTKLYLSVDMSLTGGETTVAANSTNKNDLNLIYTVVPGLKETMDGMFGANGSLTRALDSINSTVPIAETIVTDGKSGKIQCDLVGLALELSKINYENDELKPEADRVTSKDVYLALKAVIGADTDKAMSEEHRKNAAYENMEFVLEDGRFVLGADGMPLMKLVDGTAPPRELTVVQDSYEDAFMYAFSNSYGLKEDSTFDTVFDMISGGGDIDDFISLFDTDRLNAIINGTANGVTLTPQMLAALISKHTSRFLDGIDGFDINGIKPRFIILSRENIGGTDHNFMEIGVEVDIIGLLDIASQEGSTDIVNKILSALLPNSLLVTAKIDITIADEDFSYAPSMLALDNLTYDEGARLTRLLKGLKLFGTDENGEDLGLEDMMDDILSPVRGMLSMMADALPSFCLGESEILLPDVFAAIAGILNRTSESQLSAKELQENLEFILKDYEFSAFSAHKEALIDEFEYKYALNIDRTADNPLGELFAALSITENGDGFASILDVDGLKAILAGGQSLTELNIQLDGGMFAALIYEFMGADDGNLGDLISLDAIKDIVFFTESGRDMVSFGVQLSMSELLGFNDGEDAFSAFLGELIGNIAVFITADISQSDKAGDRIPTEIVLNGYNAEAKTNTTKLLNMLDALAGGFSDSMLLNIKQTIDSAVESIFLSMESVGVYTNVQDGKLYISDIFTVVSNNLPQANYIQPQSLYEVLRDVYFAEDQWIDQNISAVDKNTLIANKVDALNLSGLSVGLSMELTGLELASLVKNDAGMGFAGEVKAVYFVAALDGSTETTDLREWLGGYDGGSYTASDYILIMAELDLSAFGDIDANDFEEVLPEKIIVTLCYRAAGRSTTFLWFRINDFSSSGQQSLFKLIGKAEDINSYLGMDSEAGVENVGGKYFETLVNTIFDYIDIALHSALDSVAQDLGKTLNLSYTYHADPAALGKMKITISAVT